MRKPHAVLPVLYALLAALFYALNTPLSKILLRSVPPTIMAGLLYLGAGFGVGILYLFRRGREDTAERLSKSDTPYVIGMIVLDIAAPIFLMLGLRYGTASGAALLGNFEIVATTLIALLLFREPVSGRLWCAVVLIVISSAMLSLDGAEGLQISPGSLFVLLAASCWGLENNCTRKISDKSTYQIVILKGIFSGLGSLCIGLLTKEKLPMLPLIGAAMLLGFVAYGLSIFLYVRAQRDLGAARTSAYYAVAPFVGAGLSFLLLHEPLTGLYFAALLLMAGGAALTTLDAFRGDAAS